ncbi:MAG: hypothetical protein E4H40_04060 [Candidatus Brocadiia bacterium]|nr:MAG: hypothetical protein E4H40_04060 [Candidatus Brocadiia bacterium]
MKKLTIFDRAKNLVFEESDEEVNEQDAQTTDSENTSAPVQKVARPVAVIDDEFYRELKTDVDDASPQAYRSFMSKLQSLEDVGLIRANMIKAAFKTSGVTKADLLSALNGRKQLLNKEQIEFESALDAQTKDDIDAKEQQAISIGQSLKDHETELERLIKEWTAKIETLKTQKLELETAVATGRKMQGKAKERFSGARQKLESEIDAEISEISTLLGKG